MTDLFDAYGRRAWLMPGLIVCLPISLTAGVMIAAVPRWWLTAVGVLLASGVTVLAATAIRQHGQRIQARLWEEWGGPPTTQLLRWRGGAHVEQVARRHRLLRRLLPDEELPDAAAEAAAPEAADRRYATVVAALRERAREEDRFPRVAAENADYGFRRNLLACRPIGLALAALGATSAGALCAAKVAGALPDVPLLALFLLVVADLLLVAAYVLVVTSSWVRAAGDAYAERLLGALEIMEPART